MIVWTINLYNKQVPSEWSVCIWRGGKARLRTSSLTVAVFGFKSVFGSNILLLIISHFEEVHWHAETDL